MPDESVRREGVNGECATGGAGGSGGSGKPKKRRRTKESRLIEWSLDRITQIRVTPANEDNSSVAVRTVFIYYQTFVVGGRWVRQDGFAARGSRPLRGASAVRDLYWCAVLKFLLATPSDAAMAAMLGILEPMCQPEEVLEIGAMEEVDERQEISPPCGADSPSGCRCRCCCCCCSCCCCAVATAVVAVARNGPLLVDDAEPFDLVAHFLTNYSVL